MMGKFNCRYCGVLIEDRIEFLIEDRVRSLIADVPRHVPTAAEIYNQQHKLGGEYKDI